MSRVTSTSTGKTSLSLDWSLMVGILELGNTWVALCIEIQSFSLDLLGCLDTQYIVDIAGIGNGIKHQDANTGWFF